MSVSFGFSGGEGGNSGFVIVMLELVIKVDLILKMIVGQFCVVFVGNDFVMCCVLLVYKDMLIVKNVLMQMMMVDVKLIIDGSLMVCEVMGFVVLQVFFQMWLLVEGWNGKYMQVGCGGCCGKLLFDGCIVQVKCGYVCFVYDLGYCGIIYDNIWVIDDVLLQIDFGFCVIYVVLIIGKVLVVFYYGKQLVYSYFVGVLIGGCQVLIVVQ